MPKEGFADLPYPFDRVWDTANLVLRKANWTITKADKSSGFFEVTLSMDLLTWTEPLYVKLTRIDDNSTKVVVAMMPNYQPLDWGISSQYLDSFLSALTRSLKPALDSGDSNY